MRPEAAATAASDDLDPVLIDLVEELKQRVDAGEVVDEAAFLAEHPLYAERLREFLPAIRGLAGLAQSAPSVPAAFGDLPDGSDLGDYRLVRPIGRGGMGVVYEAVQRSLGRQVALKVLPQTRGLTGPHLERFKREAQAAARLHHTNIVPVYGIGEHNGLHFYAMQYIQGRGLDQFVDAGRESEKLRRSTEEARVRSETLPPITPVPAAHSTPGAVHLADLRVPGTASYFRGVASVGVQAAQGLAYAHGQGVLHRDVKPSNLILDDQGTVWITDFGLAKVEGEEALTHSGDVVGTLRYLAPERFEGQCDARSDVYALGVTLYELLTLRPAFEEQDRARLIDHIRRAEPVAPRRVRPEVPRDLETIVLKALDRAPSVRYASASDLADDLQRFLNDQPIKARPPRWWERLRKWGRRRPAVATLAAALLVACATLLALGAWWATSLRVALGEKVTALGQKDVALRDKEEQRARAEDARAEEEKQRLRAEKERDRAEAAAYQAMLSETHALRLGREAGWRRKALANLRTLATSAAPNRDVLELRCEAVACLTTPDLQQISLPPASALVGLDASRDGATLAGLHRDGSVTIWDFSSHARLRAIPPTRAGPIPSPAVLTADSTIRFHPRGAYLAYISAAGVEVVGVKGPAIERFDVAVGARNLAFDRDGTTLAVIGADGSVQLYDGTTGRARATLRADPRNSPTLDVHPDGTRLALARPDGSVLIRPVAGGEPRVLGRHGAAVNSLCFSRDGRRLASASQDGLVRIWNVESGLEERAWLTGKGLGHRLAFLSDGHGLVTAHEEVVLRDVRADAPIARLTPHYPHRYTGAVAVSPDGTKLAVAQASLSPQAKTSLAIFRLEGRRGRRVLGGDGQHVTALAFHPREPLAAVGGNGATRSSPCGTCATALPCGAGPLIRPTVNRSSSRPMARSSLALCKGPGARERAATLVCGTLRPAGCNTAFAAARCTTTTPLTPQANACS